VFASGGKLKARLKIIELYLRGLLHYKGNGRKKESNEKKRNEKNKNAPNKISGYGLGRMVNSRLITVT